MRTSVLTTTVMIGALLGQNKLSNLLRFLFLLKSEHSFLAALASAHVTFEYAANCSPVSNPSPPPLVAREVMLMKWMRRVKWSSRSSVVLKVASEKLTTSDTEPEQLQ